MPIKGRIWRENMEERMRTFRLNVDGRENNMLLYNVEQSCFTGG